MRLINGGSVIKAEAFNGNVAKILKLQAIKILFKRSNAVFSKSNCSPDSQINLDYIKSNWKNRKYYFVRLEKHEVLNTAEENWNLHLRLIQAVVSSIKAELLRLKRAVYKEELCQNFCCDYRDRKYLINILFVSPDGVVYAVDKNDDTQPLWDRANCFQLSVVELLLIVEELTTLK
jgi:hypothetical protein